MHIKNFSTKSAVFLLIAMIVVTVLPACASVDAGIWSTSNRRGGNLAGGAEACECLARGLEGCGDGDGCAEFFESSIFSDMGWRYTLYPYQDLDGFYVSTVASRPTAAQLRGGYVIVNNRPGNNDIYGLSGSFSLSLQSGYTILASYLFAEEDISGPGYLSYNYTRIGIGHMVTFDTNAWVSLGLNMVFFDTEEGEFPAPGEDDDTVGFGAEATAALFLKRPVVLMGTYASAFTTIGPVTNFEASIGLMSKHVHYAFGMYSLTWKDSEISGPFLHVGLWF